MKIYNIFKESKKYRKILRSYIAERILKLYSILILCLFLPLLSIVALYFSKERFEPLKGYYNLYLVYDKYTADFQIGQRVRYQSGVTIGYIQDVKRFYNKHFIQIKIKKGILVSKINSVIKEGFWGMLGNPQINIIYSSITNYQDYYLPNSVIYIKDFVPMFSQARHLEGDNMKKSIYNSLSNFPFEMFDIKKRKFLQRNYVAKKINSLGKALELLSANAINVSTKLNAETANFQKELSGDENIEKLLNSISSNLRKIKEMTDYNKNILKRSDNLFYKENLYFSSKKYLESLNKALVKIKKQPSRVIFGL